MLILCSKPYSLGLEPPPPRPWPAWWVGELGAVPPADVHEERLAASETWGRRGHVVAWSAAPVRVLTWAAWGGFVQDNGVWASSSSRRIGLQESPAQAILNELRETRPEYDHTGDVPIQPWEADHGSPEKISGRFLQPPPETRRGWYWSALVQFSETDPGALPGLPPRVEQTTVQAQGRRIRVAWRERRSVSVWAAFKAPRPVARDGAQLYALGLQLPYRTGREDTHDARAAIEAQIEAWIWAAPRPTPVHRVE